MSEYIKPRLRARFFVPLLASLLAAMMVFTGFNAPAFAEEGSSASEPHPGTGTLSYEGITKNGSEVELIDGAPKLESGNTYTVAVGYADVSDGQELDFSLPEGLKFASNSIPVPPKNQLIESLTVMNDGKTVRIKFKDPLQAPPAEGEDPEDQEPVNLQGVLGFDFKVDTRDTSEAVDVEWDLDGTQSDPIRIVFVKPGDEPGKIRADEHAKSAAGGAWNPGISVSFADDDPNREHGIVSVNPTEANRYLTYTYTVKTKEAREVVFNDLLNNELFQFAG